jgi:hypothetical protein
MRMEAVVIEHVARHERHLLEVAVLVQQQVVDAHVVAGRDRLVDEPAADVPGAADYEYAGHARAVGVMGAIQAASPEVVP